MKGSMASRYSLGIFVTLLLLPACSFVLNGSPRMVFFVGTAAIIVSVLLIAWLFGASLISPAGSPPVAKRFQFGIRDLLGVATVLFDATIVLASGFRCEADERSSRPHPLPVRIG